MTDQGEKGKTIADEVEARRQAEAAQEADTETPEITSDFVWECFRANTVGDSILFNAKHKGRFIHNADTKGEWLMFEGHSWKLDRTGRALAAVEEVALLYLNEVELLKVKITEARQVDDTAKVKDYQGQIAALKKRVNTLRSVPGRKNVLECAATNQDPLTCTYEDLDQDPWLLGVANGVIDLRTGKLRPGRPEDLITKASPIEFKGIDEPCDRFKLFLKECLDDDEIVAYLQKIKGYTITGLRTLRIFLVFFGDRAQNGKSTLMDIMYHILGPLSGPIQSEMLTATRNVKSSSGPSPDIMGMKGKRLCWASETEEGQRYAVAKVKLYCGGDPLIGRFPNDRHETTFLPSHTLYLLTNHKPHVSSDDNGFWIRQKLIEFPYTFINDPKEAWERKADTDLFVQLQAEASGILGWMVAGCLLWQKEGLVEPAKIKKATAEYRRAEDQIADYVEQCLLLNPNEREWATDLYKVFKVWWIANVNNKPLSQRKFGDLMTMRFEKEQPTGRVEYLGITLDRNSDYYTKGMRLSDD